MVLALRAENYFNNGDRATALKTIEQIVHDTKTKEDFIVKVANSYINEGDLGKSPYGNS